MGSITVFGTRSSGINLNNGRLITRIVQNHGKIGDFISAVKYSTSIGLQAYLTEEGDYKRIKIRNKYAIIDGRDVTDSRLSPQRTLTVWEDQKIANNDFSFFALQGLAGKDSFNIMKWLPNKMLDLYRQEELCSIYFDTLTSGLVYDADPSTVVWALKNHSDITNNAKTVRNYAGLRQLKSEKYSLIFKDSLYKLPKLNLACLNEHTSIIVVTFKVSKLPEQKELLFGTKGLERGVMLVKNEIQILGSAGYLKLPIIVDNYNTLCIVYKNTASRDTSYYFLNNGGNYFKTNICKTYPAPNGIYLGGSMDGKYSFNGEIVACEIYEGAYLPSIEPMRLIEIVMGDHFKRVFFE